MALDLPLTAFHFTLHSRGDVIPCSLIDVLYRDGTWAITIKRAIKQDDPALTPLSRLVREPLPYEHLAVSMQDRDAQQVRRLTALRVTVLDYHIRFDSCDSGALMETLKLRAADVQAEVLQ